MRVALAAATALALVTAHTASAQELPEEIVTEAERAGISATDLAGALNSEAEVGRHPSACTYLWFAGDVDGCIGTGLAVVAPTPYNARVACIESKESGGANVANLHGSGAGGVLQYMESTFQAHAHEMGHWDWSRWVPWQARAVAAHDLALGRRSQWTVSGC